MDHKLRTLIHRSMLHKATFQAAEVLHKDVFVSWRKTSTENVNVMQNVRVLSAHTLKHPKFEGLIILGFHDVEILLEGEARQFQVRAKSHFWDFLLHLGCCKV